MYDQLRRFVSVWRWNAKIERRLAERQSPAFHDAPIDVVEYWAAAEPTDAQSPEFEGAIWEAREELAARSQDVSRQFMTSSTPVRQSGELRLGL